jgi:hypothetical protein
MRSESAKLFDCGAFDRAEHLMHSADALGAILHDRAERVTPLHAESIARRQRLAKTGLRVQRRQELREALTDRLLIIVTDEARKRAHVVGKRRYRCNDLVERGDALGSELGGSEVIDDDSNQSPFSESDANDASVRDFEPRRRPIIEDLIRRHRQGYANDRHGIEFFRSLKRIGRKPRGRRVSDGLVVQTDRKSFFFRRLDLA